MNNLFVFFQSLSGDTVQISLTVFRDSSATLWRDFDNTDLLQSLQDPSVDGTGSIDVLLWSGSSVLGATVQFVQFTDTDMLSQVDVSGNGSSTLVEPTLRVLWRHLIACRGLDNVNVTWDLQLTLSLQERSVSVDELLCRNVSI